MTSVTVAGVRPYDVVIGHDLTGHALAEIPDRAQRVALFHAPVFTADATALAVRIAATGRQVMRQELPDAEAAKTADVLAACWRDLGAAGFTRTDVIVGLGGGATTDLVGFVAATWLRGVDVIHLPTTLLGMVDAAVGGKTGINTAAGKNLVGAIHPPRAVLCDLDRLTTLPRADLVAGLAEVVKAGFIADPRILELVEADPAAALDPTSPVLAELVTRAVQVKADVVADDLTESVDRELGRQVLNYGHTLAHAIERREQYRWRHGDAVAVGMMFAAALSHAAGRLSGADVARHRDVLTAVGLPIGYDGAAWPELRDAMSLDKKTRGATLRFVILDALARPAVLTGPDDLLLQTAFQEVS